MGATAVSGLWGCRAQGAVGRVGLEAECETHGRLAVPARPQLAPHLEVLSYWTFSDIFEENSIPRTEFHPLGVSYPQPHYGAMSLHGVPKPVWRAFELLHTHAGSHTVNTTAVTHSSSSSSSNEQEHVPAGESCTVRRLLLLFS